MARTLLIAISLVWLAACAIPQAPVVPPPAFIYQHYLAPLDPDVDATELGSKVGRARVQFIRDFLITLQGVSWGDGSVAAAARSAGITEVRHVDYEFMSVLGIYAEMTVIVYGE